MKRTALNLLTILSFVPCVAVCVLWARSYAGLSLTGWEAAGGAFYTLGSGGGRVVLDRAVHRPGYRSAPLPSYSWECLGLAWSRYGTNPQPAEWHLVVPHGLLAAGTAVLPTVRAITYFRRRRRSLPGFCAACGYDLRASPGRCPECGNAGSRT